MAFRPELHHAVGVGHRPGPSRHAVERKHHVGRDTRSAEEDVLPDQVDRAWRFAYARVFEVPESDIAGLFAHDVHAADLGCFAAVGWISTTVSPGLGRALCPTAVEAIPDIRSSTRCSRDTLSDKHESPRCTLFWRAADATPCRPPALAVDRAKRDQAARLSVTCTCCEMPMPHRIITSLRRGVEPRTSRTRRRGMPQIGAHRLGRYFGVRAGARSWRAVADDRPVDEAFLDDRCQHGLSSANVGVGGSAARASRVARDRCGAARRR